MDSKSICRSKDMENTTSNTRAGRPAMEGKTRKYIVADDAHEWILQHGGGQYITDTMRMIRDMEEKKRQLLIADDVREWIMAHGGGSYVNEIMRTIMAVAPEQK